MNDAESASPAKGARRAGCIAAGVLEGIHMARFGGVQRSPIGSRISRTTLWKNRRALWPRVRYGLNRQTGGERKRYGAEEEKTRIRGGSFVCR